MGLEISKVKKDMDFNKNFRGLIEVLKNVAIAQFHILEKRLVHFNEFEKNLEDFARYLNLKKMNHPFLRKEETDPVRVVAITTDQGLLGGINMRVVSRAMNSMKSGGRDELIIVGEKGQMYAREYQIPFTIFSGIKDDEQAAQAQTLRDYLFKDMLSGKYRGIQIVYPHAYSLVNQRVEVATLIPFSVEEGKEPAENLPSEILFESKPEHILEFMVFLWIGYRLREIFSLSRLAELGARYVHLEESSQRILDINQKLKLRYFRLRHEAIDQSLRELFAARSLFAS
jgi:F-type H+-transporting ATPase subunit gamma